MSLSDRLKEERKRIGQSQSELAEFAGVGLTSQKNYEAGRSSPDAKYLSRISSKLDVAYIISGEREGDEPADAKRVLEFDPEAAQEAYAITEAMREVFELSAEQRKAMVPVIYSFIMIGNFGTSESELITLFKSIGLPLKKK